MGVLSGAQTARILVLLATAAVAQGGLIARLMKLPRATQASTALAAETGGVALEAVGAVREVRVVQGGVAIAVEGVAKGAVGVAMAAHGAPQQPGPSPGPATETPQRGPPAAGVKETGSPLAKAARSGFKPPPIGTNARGQLTNGRYTLDAPGMAPHKTGATAGGKSQFLAGVDAEKATLDAAAYADEMGLWAGNKAKVYVEGGPVGILGNTGELTNWINVYRTRTGFVHGAPGIAP